MPRSKRLIIGLGNPGAEYAGTRHNAGFMALDAVAEARSVTLEPDGGDALVGWGSHRGCPFGLVKPITYMNKSGDAVRRLQRKHGLDPAELLVLVDDLHLDPGTIRLRPGGGTGGHNGLEHITERLGTTDFPRLRIGVGGDFGRGRQVEHVLSLFDEDEKPLIEMAVNKARDAALCFVAEGVSVAMNRFN